MRLGQGGRPTARLYLNDVGTSIVASILDQDGAAIDLSDASLLQYVFCKPDLSTILRVATATDAGDMSYALAAGDLNQAGRWQVQGYVVTPTGEWHTTIQRFTVYANLA